MAGWSSGWVATPSQPAVETVSSVSRPGESACGPCGRRNEPQVRDVVERIGISSGRSTNGDEGKYDQNERRGRKKKVGEIGEIGERERERDLVCGGVVCDSARNERIGQQHSKSCVHANIHTCTRTE